MKKLILFLVFAGLTTSCNSDDNESATITGKWYIKGGTLNGGEFQNYNHDCETKKDFQEFFENGELTFNGFNSQCTLSDTQTSIWDLNGNILTVSSPPQDPMIYEYNYVVESLTNDELILKQTVNDPEGIVVYRSTFTRD
jgi:hypothetical protein